MKNDYVINAFNNNTGGGLSVFTAFVKAFNFNNVNYKIIVSKSYGYQNEIVFKPTPLKFINSILLYFFYLPLIARTKTIVNLGDIIPFTSNQIYYFDWMYALLDINNSALNSDDIVKRIGRYVKRFFIRFAIKIPNLVIVQTELVKREISKIRFSQVCVLGFPVECFVKQESSIQMHMIFCPTSNALHKNNRLLVSIAELISKVNSDYCFFITLDDASSTLTSIKMFLPKSRGLGTIEKCEMYLNYLSAKNILITSKLESLGLCYIESMVCGKKPIVLDTIYSRAVLKEFGCYFSEHDISQVLEYLAMDLTINSSDLIMVKEIYSFNNFAKKLAGILNESK